MARMALCSSFALALLGGAAAIGVAVFTAPHRNLNAWNRDVISRLESAKALPPAGATAEQWEAVIGWTQNAFPNVFFTPNHIVDAARFREFQRQLASRLTGDVDLDTVAWIWDQVAIHGTNGGEYGRRFRSVAPHGEIHLDESGEPLDNVRLDVAPADPNTV
jgi:hypothetical protein